MVNTVVLMVTGYKYQDYDKINNGILRELQHKIRGMTSSQEKINGFKAVANGDSLQKSSQMFSQDSQPSNSQASFDSVLGYSDIITCNNVEQAGTQAAESSRSSENSPETSSAEAPSSSSSADCATPTTAVCSMARRRERKKGKGQKWPARVHDSDSEDDTLSEAMKKLTIEGEQN